MNTQAAAIKEEQQGSHPDAESGEQSSDGVPRAGVSREPSDADWTEKKEWLGTTAAAQRLGITTRTLYRFIDEGQVTAYRLGRVIRVKAQDIDIFIESCRIEPGTIGHLYPPVNPAASKDST